MENNNSFDWLAISIQDSDKTYDDLYSLGMAPENVTLKEKSFYEKSNKIQARFKGKDGSFDKDAFDKFYSDAEKSLNTYKQTDFNLGNVTTDLWEDTSIARALGKNIRKNPINVKLTSKDPYTNLKVAQGAFLGLAEINKWSDPTKSIAEVAQGLKVLDSATGKELNYTPEDNSIFNAFGFFSEPLVLSAYDEDVKDAKGNIIHKRGDLKFDENGLPRYETLNGRNPAGKQVLSRTDTLTKEGTFGNKFDFFDSDGLDKSITGSLVKTAVQVAPFLIGGPIANLYKGFYIATNLSDALLEIGKALEGIDTNNKNTSFSRFANQLQGYTAQWRSGVSDYGKSNFLSFENLANLATDSVFQLMSQKAIAQWPYEMAKYRMAKSLNIATKSALDVGEEASKALFNRSAYVAKYGPGFEKAALAMSKNIKDLEKVAKYSSYMSTAYMAATSAKQISDAADVAGLDARDKGMLYLGYSSVLIPLFRSNYARWIEEGIEINKLSSAIGGAVKEYSSKMLPKVVARELSKEEVKRTLKQKAVGLMQTGVEMGKSIANKIKNFDPSSYGGAMIAEGFEEATEQTIQEGLQAIYNGLNYYGFTASSQGKQFEMSLEQSATSILTAAAGGAIGGAVFKFADGSGHVDPFTSKELMELVVHGHGDRVIKKIKELHGKGQLGDTTMSIDPLIDTEGQVVEGMYKPVNSDNRVSQNDFIADRLTKMVDVIESMRKAYGIKDLETTAEDKNIFYNQLVDTKSDTDLRDRIFDVASRMFTLGAEIQNLSEETDSFKEKQEELAKLKEELLYLQSDESIDEYFRQGLFNTQLNLNQAWGVKKKDDFIKDVNPNVKEFDKLNFEEKEKVNELYDNYKNDLTEVGLKSDLRNARIEYETLNGLMTEQGHYDRLEQYKLAIEELGKISSYGTKSLEETATGEKIASYEDFILSPDYYNKLASLPYLPDYVFNQITNGLKGKINEATLQLLSSVVPNVNTFTNKFSSNMKGFNVVNSITAKVFEKTLGESGFEEFKNSDMVKELVNDPTKTSVYNILRLTKQFAQIYNGGEALNNAIEVIDTLKQDFADEQVISLINDVNNPLHKYIEGTVLDSMLQSVNDTFGSLEDAADIGISLVDLLINTVKLQALGTTYGIDFDGNDVMDSMDSTNVVTEMLLTGRVGDLDLNLASEIDTTPLDTVMQSYENFKAQRIASPLQEILAPIYDLVRSQMEQIDQVGVSEYSNTSPDFIAAIDDGIKAVLKTASLISAAVHLNPLVNDFRKNHRDLLDTEVTQEELFVIDEANESTLNQELSILHSKLNYIKDLNEYNSNNKLKQMLNEKQNNFSANFRTILEVADNQVVVSKLPSIKEFANDNTLNTVINNYTNLSDKDKQELVYKMVEGESKLFREFNTLTQEEKQEVLNELFESAKRPGSGEDVLIKGDSKLSDFDKTLYFARILGTDSLTFYKDYVGEFDSATGLFDLIQNSEFIPFQSQEDSIRLNYLMVKGDPLVYRMLNNAFSYRRSEEKKDFTRTPYKSTLNVDYTSMNLGAPATGKTTANLVKTITTLGYSDGEVLLAAPKERQTAGLKAVMESNNLSNVVNGKSDTISKIFEYLDIKIKDSGVEHKLLDYIHSESSKDITNTLLSTVDNGEIEGMEPLMNLLIKKSDIIQLGSEDGNYFLREDLYDKLKDLKLIVIDEFTHAHPVEIAILNKLISKFNNSANNKDGSKINMILLGDLTQLGHTMGGVRRDFASVVPIAHNKPLEITLRSGWDLINNPNYEIRRRAVKYSRLESIKDITQSIIDESKNNPIVTSYVTDYEYTDKDGNGLKGNLGTQVIRKTAETSLNDLNFITKYKNLIGEKDLVYVVDPGNEDKAKALMQSVFGNAWDYHVDVYTPNEVQGGEYKYAIIDAEPAFNDNRYDFKRAYEFLNTMLSRSTEATLFLDNGVMDEYLSIESTEKTRAIRQVKVNKEVAERIKADTNNLYTYVLKDYTAPDIKTPVKTDGESKGEEPVLPLKPIPNAANIFGGLSPQVNIPRFDLSSPDEALAYTGLNVQGDIDTILDLLPREDRYALDPNKRTNYAEEVLNSYKYYLIHKEELGDANIVLSRKFSDLFDKSNLDYDNPIFFLEVGKRGGAGLSAGRHANFDNSRDDIIISLKARLPNTDGGKDTTITIGLLTDSTKLLDKTAEGRNPKVHQLLTEIKTYVNDGKTIPTSGRVLNGVWRSEEFDSTQLSNVADIFYSRVLYNDSGIKTIDDLIEAYPEFHITKPLVVVGKIDSDVDPILNPDGDNPEFKAVWENLKGKSISLVTEVKELAALSPDKLLDVYIKQMELFNNDEFKSMDKISRQNYIDNVITDRIDLGRGVTVKYRPYLVSIIKLDNPKSKYLEFRSRYLSEIAQRRKTDPSNRENIAETFNKFDMPLYVKDRLIKSLKVIQSFLNDKNNKAHKEWFENNILSQVEKNASSTYAQIARMIQEEYDIDLGSAESTFSENIKDQYGPLTMENFISQLNDLLDYKDNPMYKGVYDVVTRVDANGNKVLTNKPSNLLKTMDKIKPSDLNISLSANKHVDFKGYIYDINPFHLFQKTKNLNFAYAIDLALTEFAKMDLAGEFKKYSLKQVFNDGKIETLVIAKSKDKLGGSSHVNNILAQAINYRGDFTTTIEGIKNAAYNINLNSLLNLGPLPKKEQIKQVKTFTTDLLNSIAPISANTLFKSDLDSVLPNGITTEEDQVTLLEFLESKVDVDYPKTYNSLNITEKAIVSQRITVNEGVFNIESKSLDAMIREILPEGNYKVTNLEPSTKEWKARYRLVDAESVNVYEVIAKLNKNGTINVSHKLLSTMGESNKVNVNDIVKIELENFDAKAEALLPGYNNDTILKSMVSKIREIYEVTVITTNKINAGDADALSLVTKASDLLTDYKVLLKQNLMYLDIDNDFGDSLEQLANEVDNYKNRTCE